MKIKFKIGIFFILFLVLFSSVLVVQGQTSVNEDDIKSLPRVEIFLSPHSGSFVDGTTFEVPIFLNTNGTSVKEIHLKLDFDKDKLELARPSGGTSIINVWLESPKFDNTKGTISYVGAMPEGIVTGSGLVATMTFRAIGTGEAKVSVDPTTEIFLNDGLDTKALLDLGRAEYSILKKMSEGVNVFSETHPSEGKWSNNNNPVVSWRSDIGVTGFSFILDNKPFTVPDNVIDTTDTTKAYENIGDGLWYFHIKAFKNGAWGNTGHFLLKIDTVPPAAFTPKVSNLLSSAILADRAIVSFFTTDNLSGVDHYEVGVVDKNQPITEAPVFVQTDTSFQVPVLENSTVKVIARAIDKAGNVQEGYVDIAAPPALVRFIKTNFLFIFLAIILIIILSRYLIKYNIIGSHKRRDNFSDLEGDIQKYLTQRKEITEAGLSEKQKIEILEKDLENVKAEMEKETQSQI